MSSNLQNNINRIIDLSKELNVNVRFDADYMSMIISNSKPGRQRTRRVINLEMDNVIDAMHWVAEKPLNSR